MSDRCINAICFVVAAALTIVAFIFLFRADAQAQGFHGDGHDRMHHWYRTLKRPDYPGKGLSCCNENDCRPTDARIVDGRVEAMLDGRWVTVPESKILKVSPPDLNSHICAPNTQYSPSDNPTIYCFVFGGGV